MNALFLLIPLTFVLLILAIVLFVWAVSKDQYQDLERHGEDILFDEDSSSNQNGNQR